MSYLEKNMERNEKSCWINENELILSFHPVVGYLIKEFDTHDELIQFVFRVTAGQHYRVQ